MWSRIHNQLRHEPGRSFFFRVTRPIVRPRSACIWSPDKGQRDKIAFFFFQKQGPTTVPTETTTTTTTGAATTRFTQKPVSLLCLFFTSFSSVSATTRYVSMGINWDTGTTGRVFVGGSVCGKDSRVRNTLWWFHHTLLGVPRASALVCHLLDRSPNFCLFVRLFVKAPQYPTTVLLGVEIERKES